MTIAYLIDTDWAIYYLHGRSQFVQRLQDLQREGLGLSAASLAELYEGVYASRDFKESGKALDDFLEGITVVDIDREIAKTFGQYRSQLRSVGMMIGDMDLLIASTALQNNLVLLTNNRRHFERIKNLRIESL